MIARNRIIHGDALKVLKTLPDKIVDCCVTSPPYYGLRDYGIDGQIGLEATPEAYTQRLVAVFHEVYRVLKNEGTLWLNLGDSYSGSGKGAGNNPENVKKYKQGTNRGLIGAAAITKAGWGECKPKDLIGIPWLLAFALRADGWFLRQEIIWSKPNAMPESVRDRPTRAHENIFLFSKSKQYYYDYQAIQEPCLDGDPNMPRGSKGVLGNRNGGTRKKAGHGRRHAGFNDRYFDGSRRVLRNKRSVWEVATQPVKEAHFATFPPELIRPCIRAGCPVGGIVLDTFMGAGTTAVVALEEGREYLGIELNEKYINEIAEPRITATERAGIIDFGVSDDCIERNE